MEFLTVLSCMMLGSFIPNVKNVLTEKVYAMTQSEYDSKVNAFINDSRWRNGVAWGASKTPEIAWNGIGCCAYINDFVRYVYGADSQKSGTQYTGVSNIQTGDVLYIYNSEWGPLDSSTW